MPLWSNFIRRPNAFQLYEYDADFLESCRRETSSRNEAREHMQRISSTPTEEVLDYLAGGGLRQLVGVIMRHRRLCRTSMLKTAITLSL